MKIAAFAWGLVVAAACAMLVLQLHRGVELQTDMTALLPFEERDVFVQRAKERVSEILAARVFLLVGDNDRANARAGGATLAKALADSGMTKAVTYRIRSDSLISLGAMYFPYRLDSSPTRTASVCNMIKARRLSTARSQASTDRRQSPM